MKVDILKGVSIDGLAPIGTKESGRWMVRLRRRHTNRLTIVYADKELYDIGHAHRLWKNNYGVDHLKLQVIYPIARTEIWFYPENYDDVEMILAVDTFDKALDGDRCCKAITKLLRGHVHRTKEGWCAK